MRHSRCDPAFWEGPNKEAKANREGGQSKPLRSPRLPVQLPRVPSPTFALRYLKPGTWSPRLGATSTGLRGTPSLADLSKISGSSSSSPRPQGWGRPHGPGQGYHLDRFAREARRSATQIGQVGIDELCTSAVSDWDWGPLVPGPTTQERL